MAAKVAKQTKASANGKEVFLNIPLSESLRTSVKMAALRKGVEMREYVREVLTKAVAVDA